MASMSCDFVRFIVHNGNCQLLFRAGSIGAHTDTVAFASLCANGDECTCAPSSQRWCLNRRKAQKWEEQKTDREKSIRCDEVKIESKCKTMWRQKRGKVETNDGAVEKEAAAARRVRFEKAAVRNFHVNVSTVLSLFASYRQQFDFAISGCHAFSTENVGIGNVTMRMCSTRKTRSNRSINLHIFQPDETQKRSVTMATANDETGHAPWFMSIAYFCVVFFHLIFVPTPSTFAQTNRKSVRQSRAIKWNKKPKAEQIRSKRKVSARTVCIDKTLSKLPEPKPTTPSMTSAFPHSTNSALASDEVGFSSHPFDLWHNLATLSSS